jgi:hypothetical protein
MTTLYNGLMQICLALADREIDQRFVTDQRLIDAVDRREGAVKPFMFYDGDLAAMRERLSLHTGGAGITRRFLVAAFREDATYLDLHGPSFIFPVPVIWSYAIRVRIKPKRAR